MQFIFYLATPNVISCTAENEIISSALSSKDKTLFFLRSHLCVIIILGRKADFTMLKRQKKNLQTSLFSTAYAGLLWESKESNVALDYKSIHQNSYCWGGGRDGISFFFQKDFLEEQIVIEELIEWITS